LEKRIVWGGGNVKVGFTVEKGQAKTLPGRTPGDLKKKKKEVDTSYPGEEKIRRGGPSIAPCGGGV